MTKHHTFMIIAVTVLGGLYIAFNVWIFFFAKSGGLKTNPAATITEKIKSFGGLRENQSPKSSPPKGPVAPPPTPTPTPKTGPGPHGCDPYGVCNLYNPAFLKENCTVTYADPDCLGACSDPAKRCKK